MPNLSGPLSGIPHSIRLRAAMTVLALTAAGWAMLRRGIAEGFAATLISGLLLSYQASAAVLLAPTALAAGNRQPA